MHRFFIEEIDSLSKTVKITNPEEIHHIKNVVRLKEGDYISVFDGKGKGIIGQILVLGNDFVNLEVKKQLEEIRRKQSLVLACAIPKKTKFETIIEKCTELGVDEIIPIITKRTEVILKGDRADKKNERYQAVAVNAAKQCKRMTFPVIHPPTPFKNAFGQIAKKDIAFISCLFGKSKTFTEIKKDIKGLENRIFFFIGPEGDFTEDEIEFALKKGCRFVSLGETTLKVDTAAIVVVAMAKLYLLK